MKWLMLCPLLISCTTTVTAPTPYIYELDERVCYFSGGSRQLVTVRENVHKDQMTVLIRYDDGTLGIVDVGYVQDAYSCSEESE